jgi:hypothetical protein
MPGLRAPAPRGHGNPRQQGRGPAHRRGDGPEQEIAKKPPEPSNGLRRIHVTGRLMVLENLFYIISDSKYMKRNCKIVTIQVAILKNQNYAFKKFKIFEKL